MPQGQGRGRVAAFGLMWVGWLTGLAGCSGSAPAPTVPQGGAGVGSSPALDSRSLESLGIRVDRLPASPAGPAWSRIEAGGSRIGDGDLAALGGFERIEIVNLNSTKVGDAGLSHLSGLTSLKWLYLSQTLVTDAGLRGLEPLQRLEILDVAGTAVGDAGLERIAGLGSLSGLDLTGTRVTDAGLSKLAPLGRLEVLRLGETAVTDSGLKALAATRSLKSLSLDGCRGVRGSGLRSLAALPDLQVLVLNGSPIDDDGMVAIGTLAHLSELHLEGTSVSDAGLARLRGLTSLRKVFLHGSRCTDGGAKALAVTLPGSAVTLEKLTHHKVPDWLATARESTPFERTANVIYGWKHGMALTMDVLKPGRPANGAAVVWVCGDSFYSRHEMITPQIPLMDALLGRGYHVFAVTHGSTPLFNAEEATGDVHRAVRFIRHNARSYGIDPRRIGAVGRSGAGYLALMLGMGDGLGWRFEDPIARGELAILDPIDGESGRVAAVACFYGPTDLTNYGGPGRSILVHPITAAYRAPFVPREFDDRTRTYREVTDPARVAKWLARVSPLSHVSRTSAPVLFFHGEKDENVPLQQSRSMTEALRSAGVACELRVKAGAGHGWDDDPADMAQVADWFDRHLGLSK